MKEKRNFIFNFTNCSCFVDPDLQPPASNNLGRMGLKQEAGKIENNKGISHSSESSSSYHRLMTFASLPDIH